MKHLIVLKALSSIQAHSKHLRIYVQIDLLERRKLETQILKWQQTDVVFVRKSCTITYIYSSESGGTSDEVLVMRME